MIAAVEGKDLVPLAINASELETCAEEIVGRIPILPWSPDLLDTIHRTVISILQRYCAYRGSPHQHARRQVVQFLQQKLVAFFNHQIVQEGAWE